MSALHDIVKKGSTDRSVTLRIIDAADGTPELGVVFNTSGIDLWYRREGAARTAITEATLAALTTAHTDGGFLHISDAEYRLDLPDAAFATGANHVDFGGTVTGMVVIGGRVRLVDYDPEDTVRLGLTALPNAAAEAAGGLYTRGTGAGQVNQNANGQLDARAVAVSNDAITAAAVADNAIDAGAIATGAITAAKFAAGAIDAAAIAANAITDAKVASDVTIASVTGAVGSVTGAVGSVTSGVTVTTNNDKTGYGLSAAAVQAIWDALTSALTAVGSIGKLLVDNINATISSRATPAQVATELATYDGPTNAEMVARTLLTSDYATAASATAIEADTQDIQGRLPAALVSGRMSSDAVAISGSTTAADNVEANIGNLDATVSSRLATAGYTAPPSAATNASAVRTELTTELGRIDAAVSTRATPAQVNSEVLDVLTVDTFTEPSSVPAATSTIVDKLRWLFALGRNKVTQSTTTQSLRNDADSASIGTAGVSDDGSTFTRNEWS